MQQENKVDERCNRLLSSLTYVYHYRQEIRNRFPDFWNLRVVKKPLKVLIKELPPQAKILDIGAGNREMGEKVRRALPKSEYKSMDVDQGSYHDFHSLDDVNECFDAVFLFEVIEHLDLREGIELLNKIHSILVLKGRLFLTTPNLHHPHRYWSCHHKTPYRYDELGAILLALGLEPLSIFRIYNDAFLKRVLRIYVARYLHRYLQIDFAPSIMLVAQKGT